MEVAKAVMMSYDLPLRTEWQIVWPQVESRIDPLPRLRNLTVQLKLCAMPCAWQGRAAVTLSVCHTATEINQIQHLFP